MGLVQRQLVKGVMWVVSYPWVTLAVCAVLLVASVLFARARLTLSTDQNALLTPELPFFKDYLEFDAKFPENEAFVVLVEPKDRANPPHSKRWIAFANAVQAKLLTLKGVVRRVDTHVPLEELGDQALLFAEWDDVREGLAQMQEMRPLTRSLAKAPTIADLTDVSLLGGGLHSSMTVRFFTFMANDPKPERSYDFARIVAESLDEALQTNRGAPNLNDLDPKAAHDPSRYGYNMIVDESKRHDPKHKNDKLMVINVFDERDYTSLADVTEPLHQMREAVAEVSKDFPEFTAGFTGRPALEADEMRTSDRDTRKAEILGLSLVFIVLWIFLRRLWLVVVAELCLGVGIGWTFGWATLAVGRLNLLSLVFVIALIGIGMDYLIQILTRYRFEKKRYARAQAIWVRVFRYVSPPISTACMGAAGAFFVANLTDFKGAAELGIIAGGGLLLCLLGGYTLLPALLTVLPSNVGRVAEENRYVDPATVSPAKSWRMIIPALWIALAAAGLIYIGLPKFDPNLLKLQAARLESVKLVHKLPTWYGAVLTSNLDDLQRARVEIEKGDRSKILKTDSLLDSIDKQKWLSERNSALKKIPWKEPAAPEEGDLEAIADAAEKVVRKWDGKLKQDMEPLKKAVASLAATLRDPQLAQRNINYVDGWQKRFHGTIRAAVVQFTPGPLEIERLPKELKEHYVSTRAGLAIPRSEAAAQKLENATAPETRNATSTVAAPNLTYAMYVYPVEDLWEDGKIEPFVKELEARTPKDIKLTGIAVQLYHSTQAIHGAFGRSTFYALVLIFLLVLLDLRKLTHTLLAVSVLALGLPMLLMMMALWRWWGDPMGIPGTWNFANFFGLPILIGAGHEYGVFMVHRYRETVHDPRRVWRRWDVSDRALLLCAIVTSSSFGFLIGASHRGLASLGWVMAVGSACIYLATVLVLRPILQWRLRKRGVYGKTG